MSGPTWLSQATFDRLREELATREGAERGEILERINRALCEEGPLSENTAYHLAKDEQGRNEARIGQLHETLDHAVVGAPDEAPADRVAPGRIITVQFDGGSAESFLLASREESPDAAVDVASPSSPLGAALLGRSVCESVAYVKPSGDEVTVHILRVEPAV